jgi:hypothetical protein
VCSNICFLFSAAVAGEAENQWSEFIKNKVSTWSCWQSWLILLYVCWGYWKISRGSTPWTSHVKWWRSNAAHFIVFPSDRPAVVTFAPVLVPPLKNDVALTRFRRVVVFGLFDPCEGWKAGESFCPWREMDICELTNWFKWNLKLTSHSLHFKSFLPLKSSMWIFLERKLKAGIPNEWKFWKLVDLPLSRKQLSCC